MNRQKIDINLPNALTLCRILITPLFVILMLRQCYGSALAVFTVAGITDGLDGLLARVLKKRTELGAHLDPIADKLLLITAFVTLAVMNIVPSWLAVIVISRDVLIIIGITVLVLTRVEFVIQPSRISKWTTAIQLTTIGYSLLEKLVPVMAEAMTALIWTTAVLTILSGLHYIYIGMNILQGNGAGQA